MLKRFGPLGRITEPSVIGLDDADLLPGDTVVSLVRFPALDAPSASQDRATFPSNGTRHIDPSLWSVKPIGLQERQIRPKAGEVAEIAGDLFTGWWDRITVMDFSLALTLARTDGSLFFRARDEGAPARVVAPHVAGRTKVRRGDTPPPPITKIKVFELLLPILLPPMRTEFGEEFLLPAELYPFQRYGVKWLVENDSALLADDMGLGKTVQAIVAFRVLLRQGKALQALVVCPKSIRLNWMRELERWAPELISLPIAGSRETRHAGWRGYIGRSHVLVATYDSVRQDSEIIRGRPFDLVILDEIQRIKNPQAGQSRAAKQLSRARSWGLTGTPLENRIDDVVSVFGFVKPNLFRTSETPVLQRGRRSYEDELAELNWTRTVKARISPHMLRRRKEEALKELPPKVKDIKFIELQEAQRRSYERAEEQGIVRLKGGQNITIQHVLALITQLKKICNFDPETRESAKLEFLDDYLEDAVAEESKVLVFSQFVQSLRVIEGAISHHSPMAYVGELSEAARQRVLDEFKTDPEHKVLLLSLRAGGVGLNLPEANYVLHFDSWWNPAVESQAEDRVHRIGQTKTVFVTTLVCLDTIEERIQRLLEKKRQLFTEVIDDLSDIGLTRVLSREELFGLFNLKPPLRLGQGAPEAPKAEIAAQVTPETPYSNLLHLQEVLRACKDYIWWLDKHFHAKALELLVREVEPGRVSEVRILSSRANLDDDAMRDFRRFRDELKKRGVVAEWRVDELHEVHDRYIVSAQSCHDVPPVNTLFSGGWSDITPAAGRPPFETWWARAKGIFG